MTQATVNALHKYSSALNRNHSTWPLAKVERKESQINIFVFHSGTGEPGRSVSLLLCNTVIGGLLARIRAYQLLPSPVSKTGAYSERKEHIDSKKKLLYSTITEWFKKCILGSISLFFHWNAIPGWNWNIYPCTKLYKCDEEFHKET